MMMNKTVGLAALMGLSTALFMGAVTPAGALCSNGLEGVASSSLDVCCTEGCTTCGGSGCNPGNNTLGLTSADCCTEEIRNTGIYCNVTEAAPCIISVEPAPANSTCDNGLTGIQDPETDVCCPLICGESCGGVGCGSIPGVDASDCCATNITDSGMRCSETVGPPCIVVAIADPNATCSNGLAGIEDADGTVCCDAACGQCGGDGCGDVAGFSDADCCSATIEGSGELCSIALAAPCKVDPPEFTPSMCPNGLAGVQDDTVCCAEECNLQCGGVGCGAIAGTNGASDCCSTFILANGTACEVGVVEAPCIMPNGSFTNAPVAAPTVVGATIAPVVGFTFTSAPTMLGEMDVPTSAPTGAPTSGATEGSAADVATPGPTVADGDRDIGILTPSPTVLTPSPADTNGDGIIDSRDGIAPTPVPTAAADDDAAADAAGSGALSAAVLPSGAVYAGTLGMAIAGGAMLLL
ncbi:unnamed protein product [Pylaiella littoralis]